MLDVAIVGYGPVGALLARLMAQRGFSVGVFEREAAAYPLPRAVHFDGEVMRIFQSAGVADEVAAVTRASTRGMHFVDGTGRVLMIRRGLDGVGPHGWHQNHYFHQPDLERVLRTAAEASGAQVRHSAEVIDVQDAGAHARVVLRDGRTFEARYVVGCDGARSLVRRLIGTPEEDLGMRSLWLVADLIMHPGRAEALGLPDYTLQHCDPHRPMTQCYVTGNRRRWEMMLKPGEDPTQLMRPENAWKNLARWLTPEDAELERTAVYTFQSLIAGRWRNGRLLIAGDAAHQTPPFIGQGMCAGIRDCANLAWKLERVLRGQSSEALLDTYETERKPNVRSFIDLAVRVGEVILADGEAARERDRQFKEGSPQVFNFPPSTLGPGAHSGSGAAGEIFPQPTLSDGRRLDDATGRRFAVLGRSDILSAAGVEAVRAWTAMDAAVITDPAFDAWLHEHDAAAVILRPDHHVLGTAKSAAELAALSVRMPALCYTAG